MKYILSFCKPRALYISWILVGLTTFLYSWTQVDLGLTIVNVSLWQTIQKSFQHIGYFERPLSAFLYCILIAALFFSYGYTLDCIRKGKITIRSLWILIGIIFGCLVLSYPAFSYDFFNYMFTAKTVLIYHKNPWAVTPLQFTGYEPWLSFMHWTHLPSAYAPVWVVLTVFPYILGFKYFLWIMWNMKVMIGSFYLLTAWGIGKILEEGEEKDRLLGIAIFACNPLIIIETLVSGHNDIVMSGLAIIGLYLMWSRRRMFSFFILSLSIAVKEMSLSLIPLWFIRKNRWLPFFCMSASLVLFLILFKREMLGWYAVWIIPFAAIVPNPIALVPVMVGGSLGMLLTYVPFLYYGHWNEPVKTIILWVGMLPFVASIGVTGFRWIHKRARL